MAQVHSPKTFTKQLDAWTEPLQDEFLVRWGARYAPAIIGKGESYRWIASVVLHSSWSQCAVAVVGILTFSIFCERRSASEARTRHKAHEEGMPASVPLRMYPVFNDPFTLPESLRAAVLAAFACLPS